MFKLFATIVKDVRILWKDKVGISLMFIMPAILVIVATNMQDSTFQLVSKNKLPILICNKDTGQASKQLITAIANIGMFNVSEVKQELDERQLPELMHTKEAMISVIIPFNFSLKVTAKSKSMAGKALTSFGLQADSIRQAGDVDPLTLYYNPVLQESLLLSVQGAVQSAIQIVESRATLRSLYFSINEEPMPEKLENEMLNNKTAINEIAIIRGGTSITPNVTQHNVPAWTIFAMFFVIMSLGGSIVREKVSGSSIRLKTLPTHYILAVLSKQIVYLCVTLLQTVVIFSIGILLFPFINLPALNLPSDKLALFIITIVCGLCAVSYAICVGVFAKTQEQVNGFGAISIVILSALGGLMVPSFALQGFFKSISNLSPMHWCIQAYYTLFLEGGKLADIMSSIIPILIFTLLLQFATYLGLKRKKLL